MVIWWATTKRVAHPTRLPNYNLWIKHIRLTSFSSICYYIYTIEKYNQLDSS